MSPLALILTATLGHALLGGVTLAVVCRYERRSAEAQDRRREAFTARMERRP